MKQRPKYDDSGFYYVPRMQAGGDQGQALRGRIDLGTPKNVDADGIMDGTDIAAAGELVPGGFNVLFDQDDPEIMGFYGRNLTVVASGAATSVFAIYGRDYLGQRIKETGALNGTTPVVGVKAFKWIDKITWALTAGTTVDIGWGTKFGLPYNVRKVNAEYADEVAAAAGTLTAGVLTDPQTATTGDPRGLYVPTTTPDGAKHLVIDAEWTDYVNSGDNGGLHGIKHYNAA